jgi:hypothetical protein
MKTRLELALRHVPAAVRLLLVVISLLALALGAGAPDSWSGGGG